MKKRNGFVSNSSSSSFVVLGKHLKKEELNLDLIKNKKFKLYFVGKYLNEGIDIIELDTKEKINIFKYLYKNNDSNFMLSYKDLDEDDYTYDYEFCIKDLLENGLTIDDKFSIITHSKDYNCSYSLSDINYNYFNNMPNFEEIVRKLDRTEKLKRINND